MSKAKLFQFAVIYNPTDKQKKDDDAKPSLLVPITTILAEEQSEVTMKAAMAIPQEYQDKLSQIEIAVRPF